MEKLTTKMKIIMFFFFLFAHQHYKTCEESGYEEMDVFFMRN